MPARPLLASDPARLAGRGDRRSKRRNRKDLLCGGGGSGWVFCGPGFYNPWVTLLSLKHPAGSRNMALSAAQIAQQKKQAEEMLFSGPEHLGFAKRLFFGQFRADP